MLFVPFHVHLLIPILLKYTQFQEILDNYHSKKIVNIILIWALEFIRDHMT